MLLSHIFSDDCIGVLSCWISRGKSFCSYALDWNIPKAVSGIACASEDTRVILVNVDGFLVENCDTIVIAKLTDG